MRGGHFELGAQRGDRAAQFVGGVGDEAPLAFDGGLQGRERLVGGAGEAGDLVVGGRFGDPACQVLGGGDRRHLAPDALDRAQGAPGDQPGHARDDADQQREADQHDGGRGVHRALLGVQRAPGGDGEPTPVTGLDPDRGEPVVLRGPVDGRGTVGEVGVGVDLAGFERDVVIITVVVIVVAGRAGPRRAGGDLCRPRPTDPLKVLAGRDERAVLVDDLDRRLIVQVEPAVGPARGELGGDVPGGALGFGPGLVDEIGPQGQQHSGARRDQRHRDDERGTEGRPRPNRPEQASHRPDSSRYPAPRTVRMRPGRSLRRRVLM